MADDDGLDEAFKGLGEDPAPVTPPVTEEPKKNDKPTPEETPEKTPETPESPAEPKKAEDEKAESGEKATGDKEDNKSEEKGAEPTETPETPPAPEEPKPLTKDDVQSVVSDLLNTERSTGRELETAAKEVLDAYYPDGLSNVLTDEKSGKELRTPADVVEASGDSMSTEEAAQWLMNEQYKLDQSVTKIRDDAKQIAETTVKFKQDSATVLQKYEPLFKAYPKVQQDAWDQYKALMKVDEKKNVILSAPDMLKFYDLVMDPYRLAFEHSQQQSATNPTPPATPEPPKPTAEDRMDEGGDGGATVPDDPNNFAQQVSKELSKGV